MLAWIVSVQRLKNTLYSPTLATGRNERQRKCNDLTGLSPNSRERARSEKSYAIDVAFMDKRENAFSGENLGWRLETMVYLELLRRKAGTDHDIFYFQNRGAEADFIVCDGNKTLAVYQVSYDISNPKTRKREIKGCIEGAKSTQCDNIFLITDHESEIIEESGYTIHVIPIWEWLTREEI